MAFLLWALIGLCLSLRVLGQVVPFTLIGALDSATADSSDFNSGGKVSVNGVTITVPKNLQVQFPAAFVPFVQVAGGSLTGNEVSVTGNYVDGVAIAGLIQLAQFQGEFNSGIVESVNFADGSMKIAGGPTIRINDPNAVYSKGYTSHPFFTSDDANPSITAFSGFPMCIPRSANDPKCPASNRPAGRNTFQAPDPLTMAPFLAGDYIEYSGIKVGGEIICYSIVAPSVQITTTGVPAYIRVEDALVGVFDGTGSEFADTRFIGYVSDPSVSVLISAIDVDPCTGDTTDRTIGSATPRPVTADARGKWTYRAESTTFSKYTREYRITTSTGTKLTNNGILAGQYVQPVTEWIFPEPLAPGVVPVPNDFSQFTYLANGIGPDASGNVFGPLSPWPGAKAPTPSKLCPSQVPPPSNPSPTGTAPPANTAAPTATATSTVISTPVANAGADLKARPGVVVTLSGKNGNADIAAGDLTFAWTQTAGPTITLTGADKATASFTAPATASLTNYTFALTVKSTSAGTNSTDAVVFTNDPSIKDVVVVESYTWTSSQSGTISVTARTNVVDGSAKLSLFLLNPTAGGAIAMTSQGGGRFSYNARSTKQPTNGIRVTSNLGGQDAKGTVTAKRKRAEFAEAMARRRSLGWMFGF